ncbi:toxin glutamine deamidase domain-containing protein [Micromonospora sp. NPDC049903]|uniref:toxin glutamine deamidase domain-containing protein n=1 Tax=Micromonospora sp. NPDC049903 TaxID=3364276 RepID=UPI00379022DC
MAVPNPRNSLGEYAWVWDAICWVSAGEAWPSGDEDKMRELADAWQVMADAITEALGEADPAVMKILQAWGGGAGEAFGGLWNQIAVDPNTGLPLMQEVAAAYAAGCDQAALEIEYAKLTVLIAVFITVIAVFVALLMAWLGGVSAGAIPGILAAGRQAVTVAFRRLIAQMGRQLLTRAGMQTALRAAGTRLGQIVSSQGFRQGMTRLGLELVEEIGEELIIDVGAQAYQMHTGERRQWDGNRTLTAGVGGAFGGVLGTGMSFAGRRLAPRMPFSFSPSGLTFPGSGVVRWGSRSLASGMQNAVVSPAASVLANGTVNGQWAMPGAEAFLGGFTSGAGRTGLTMIGSSMGNVGANVTNWGLGRTGAEFNPGAGLPAGGIDPALNVGGANGLGNVGGVNGGAGTGSAGAGSTGSGATGGTNGGAATNATSGSSTGATNTDTSGTASGATGSTSADSGATVTGGADGALNVPGDGNIDTTPVDTVPDSGSGSISLAPPSADAAVTSPADTSAVPSADGATTGTPTTTDSVTGTPVGVVAEGPATAPAGDTAATNPPTSDTTTQRVPDGQVAPTPDSVGADRLGSGSTDKASGGPVTAPGPEAGTTTPGDGTAGPARSVTETPTTDGFADTRSVDVRVDPTVADTPPAVLFGNSVTAPPAAQTPGNVAPTVPSAANSAPPAGSTVSTGPQVVAGPNAASPANTAPPTTTAGPPTTGTNNAATTTAPSTTNPTAQPAANRTPPVGPTVNPAAANSAGSVSLSPSTGPTSTSPNQPGTGPQQSAPNQQATPAQGVPAQQDTTSRPDNRPAPGRTDAGVPTAPTVPAQTAGSDPAATTVDTSGPTAPDTAGDPALGRTDQVSQTDGPVVVPVPGSTGSTVHSGPVGPVGPGMDTGQVNPDTLRRSDSPTGRGTHSWQLDPTSVDGDPAGPDAQRSLVEASRTLAETVRRAIKSAVVSKSKQPGMAGALLMPGGVITTHTSMTADRSTSPPTQPAVHPLAQAALDRIAAQLGKGKGGGHGKCAEVALVSDQLYQIEQQWHDAGKPGAFEQYALTALDGAKIVTHQVKSAWVDGVPYELGHYRPPCRSCAHFLPQFNVEPLTDSERSVDTYQPPVPGLVGNGRPLSETRPYGRPEGLVAPQQADQDALADAVPREPVTGRPTPYPDPRLGVWAGLLNDGGPTVPGRSTNCADVGLSVLSTWYGRPEVAALTEPSAEAELGSTARQEQALQARFSHQGSGNTALEAVAARLLEAGPGSAALVAANLSDSDERGHTWNAVNHEGTIIWLDGQNATLSDGEPLYADRVGDVWVIVLDAEGDPVLPTQTDGTTSAVLPPDSTASDDGPRIEQSIDPASVVDPRFTDPNAAIWPDMQGWPMPDTRQYGPEQLAPLEDPRYQDDVADSLWTPEGYAVFADPSTHPYGRLINDGGPDQPGRSNNCVDSTLAALASFYGDPQVSHPRWPDRLDDGSIEAELGELAGVDRIANWIGGDWVGDGANDAMPGTPAERAEAMADRYAELYQSVRDAGPGAAAVVVVDWVQFDGNAAPLLDAAGHTQAAAQHAFLLVYPDGADGPVWWDPLYASTTTDPHPGDYVGLTHNLWSMEVHPGYADEQGGSPAADDSAARDGQPGGGLPVRVRLGSPGDALPAAAGPGTTDGPGGLHHRPDGSGDRASQPAATVGHEAVHDGPPGGPDHRPPGLADGGPDGLTDVGPAPSLPESRRYGPGELAPLEDPRFQDDLAASLATPEGYAVFADPSTHPYGQLVNDGGPEQPGRANNCLDASLAALASFHGDPQVSVPRWADRADDGAIDLVSGERGGLQRAEAWIGGEWIGGPDILPTDLSARTEAVADQYADLYQQVAEAGPGASALVVADWVYVDAAGQPVLDASGQLDIDGAHAFVIVFPIGADAPVWWDPQSGTTSTDMPAADIRETHALWAMMMPDGEGRVDRGRGADTDQPSAGDPESDRAPGVRVRLAGPGETLGAGTGLGDARGPGELHHRPLGSDHRSPQPAAPAGHAGVRPGATRGTDQGPAGVARGGTDSLTGPADRTEVGDARANGDRAGTVITASALPGTDFHGQGRADPDPDAVLDRARTVAGQVATHAGVTEVSIRPDGTYQVTRADGSTFTLRLTSGPVADGAVATGRFGSDGVAVVTLSDQAADRVVERALAHEVAELSALGRPMDPGAPTVAPLSPADLAELRTAAHQVAVADRWSLGAARRELAAVVDRLGLRDGMLGAEQRLAGVPDATRTALTEVYPDWYTDRRGKALDRLPAAPTSDPRPTGLPRLRTYVITHFATNSLLAALAVKLTVDAGRPELALMLGVGGAIGAVATGPAKWLAKRVGLAAEDRRARHDARQDARSAADSDLTTGREVAGRADDVGASTRAADSATASLESHVEALGQRLDAGERRRRLIGRPRRFAPPDPGPSAGTAPAPTTNRPGDPAATTASPDPVGLTPHEQGRLAELRALAAQRDAASTFARPRVTREIRGLLDALGLRQDTPGVAQRRELLPEDLRSMADRFGGTRTAMVRHRLAAVADGRPAEGDRPGKVAPWWMGTVENTPSVLAAGSIAVVGDLIGQLRLGWFAITAGLTAMASGAVVDPIMARREAAAKDARDAWDTDHPAMPADAQLTQLTEAVAGPVDLVTERVADVSRRAADLEQRVADLDRRLAESHRRNGAADSFRRLLFGDPAWAGLTAPDATSSARPGDPAGTVTTTADPSTGTRDPGDAAALTQLAELAAQHDAASGPARIRHARHLRALLDQLGLRDGTPGAEQRREHLPAELRQVAERHGRRLLADRMARIFVGRPADATDSDARPSNVPNAGVYAVEQSPGPLVQAATTVGLAGVVQVAAGAGPLNMAAGGVLGPVRDLALKRMETSVKDARRKWDLDHPNPAADSSARVDRLAAPTEVVVADAARRLRVAVANLDRVTAAVDRLAAQRSETGPPTPTPPPSQDGDTATTEGRDVLSRADSWELQVARSHVRNADPMSLKPALRELYAVIDRLGLREGMFGRAERLAQLPPEARQVVVDYGGDRASRSVRLRTLRAEQRGVDRPPGVPSLKAYLRASIATTGLAAAGGTAIAIALSSPLAPIIPVAALAAVPVIGAAKWYAKRAGLAADDVRTRFDARSDARSAADRVDQVVDQLQEPVRELEQATADLEARLDAAESAADRLTERLAGAQQRNGVLGRLFGAFQRSADPAADPASPDPAAPDPAAPDPTAPDPTSPDPTAGRPDGGTDPDSGRITAAPVPNSGFHGLGRPTADPAAVLDLARAALPQIAPYAQVDAVVQVGPDLFEIRAAGQYPLTVRLTTGPMTDGVVAQSTREPDGTFTVTVSDRAVDQVVARALAHEVAELVALHESGQALVGPLDPGNVDGRIDPAGLSAHDLGRMAEIRLLAAAYADADPAGRLALRTELDALAAHLGLRVGDPDVRDRWALLPGDVLAHLVQLSLPALTPDAVSAVLAGAPTLTEVERVRMFDYRAQLAPDFQVPQQADLTARLRELAVEVEWAQAGLPRMPSFAGQIVGLRPGQIGRIRAVDPGLADRVARDGVYVDVAGRYDLRPYMVNGVPEIDLGAARPAFDLTTESGRRAQLHEDRQRAHAALRALHGDQAAVLLADHEFHYHGTARWMGLVPDVLTEALRAITPVPRDRVVAAETVPTQEPSGDVSVTADRVTLPSDTAGGGPVYGSPRDARTGQPAPLFDGPPKREDVQQGGLGDCGMIAVIGSVAGHLPDTVAQMFQPNPDGSVDVLLHETDGSGSTSTPTGRRLRVTVFPDVPVLASSNGRSAYADQSTVGTSWASLLEKAIAAVDRTWTPQRHDQWQRGWSARPDVGAAQAAPLGYARLDNGSTHHMQAELLSQLTGLPTRVNQFDPTPGRESDAQARLAELLAAGSPVITGTRPAKSYESYEHGKPPHGLYAGHAYEVVSVTDGKVRLRNPWNDSHPEPMPIRDFLDLTTSTYAHVELARSTVTALPDSGFHGHGRPVADPAAVLDRARLVLPTLAESIGATQVVAVGPDVFEVRADGLDPLRVRVTTGELATGTVAQTIRNLDGTFTLTVSDRAADSAVDRALAHETAELLARHETGDAQVGLFDQDAVDGPIDPAGLTAADRGRLAELRVMAAWYVQGEPATRVALRAEIDALVDHLGLRWGTPDVQERLSVVPGDVWHHVLMLSLPAMTPETVTDVLAYQPDPTLVERYRAIDYRDHLAPDFRPPPEAAELTAKLRELAVHGEQRQSSMPRMPALAGQLVYLPPSLLDQIRQIDPRLADRVAAEGVYVDLTGRFDLRPYTVDGVSEFTLGSSAPAYDLRTPAGRQALLAEDRVRVDAAFRAAYGTNPAAMAVLATHAFHYQTDARRMALVPNALTEALRLMMPPETEVDIEVTSVDTGNEVVVAADRLTLPDLDPRRPVDYGRPMDVRTGRPAPVFDGPPHREQVRQGMLGDCGMLASIAAVAGHRPDALAQLFRTNADGTVDVLLHESTLLGEAMAPTGRRLRITVTPDVPLRSVTAGSTAYADQSINGAAWASLLEKALAAVDRTWSAEQRQLWQSRWLTWHSPNDPHQAAPTGYARLDVGSTPDMQAQLLTQLTGAPSRASTFDARPGQEAAVAARLGELLASGSPVITGTLPKRDYPEEIRDDLPFGLVPGHSYEVVAVADGRVSLRNPWNFDHPAAMPIRDFLKLASASYAHLDIAPAVAAGPAEATAGPLVTDAAPAWLGTPGAAPKVPAQRESERSYRHSLGRTFLEEHPTTVGYFALLGADGTVNGLLVVVSSEHGQRTAHWSADGGQPGVGGSVPVSREAAEQLAQDVLGFRLPEESVLHDMVNG